MYNFSLCVKMGQHFGPHLLQGISDGFKRDTALLYCSIHKLIQIK